VNAANRVNNRMVIYSPAATLKHKRAATMLPVVHQ
jgi:hypothetical protein